MSLDLKQKLMVIIYGILLVLILNWCSSGFATVLNDGCFDIQQMCDAVLEQADEVMLLQAKAYAEVNKQNKQLETDIMKLQKQNFDLKHPPWHQDPMWTGLAGILGGMFLVLSLQK